MSPLQSSPIPPELVGIVAHFIAEGGYSRRTQAILACRLVCRTFAQEFRPHLFRNLHIHGIGGSDGRLQQCCDILRQDPAKSALVKRPYICPDSQPPHLGYIAFTKLYRSRTLLRFQRPVPGLRTSHSTHLRTGVLNLDSCASLPPSLFLCSPKIKKITIQDVDLYETAPPDSTTQHSLEFSIQGELSLITSSPLYSRTLLRAQLLHIAFGWERPKLRDVQTIIDACPSLKALELRLQHLQTLEFTFVDEPLSPVDLSHSLNLTKLFISFSNVRVKTISSLSRFLTATVTSASTSAAPSPIRTIQVTFDTISPVDRNSSRSWPPLDWVPAVQTSQLCKLELVEFRLVGFPPDSPEPASQWVEHVFPSLPAESRKVILLQGT
ncbi:hypothetical protein BKA70DRAFT_1569414 [Coprinopsis sp. MPI-PUGE-AT-0042]|nr:hypothetical protein BKA70DRAFT_1569414 [Coprinopsis sp. MPI-PUGE-AT-0042]